MTRPVYHITASNGRVYEVEADNPAQARRLSDFIESRIAAGDTEISGGTPPDNAQRRETPPDPNATGLRATVDGAVQGGTFNWGDEIAAYADAHIPGLAGLDNLLSGGDRRFSGFGYDADPGAYQHNLDVARQQQNADLDQHPNAYHTGNIAGTVTSVLAPEGRISAMLGNLAARTLPRAAIPLAARVASASIGAPVRFSMARGALTGGAIGGLAGAGEGEGNRWQSGVLGTVAGGAGGAVLDPLISAFVPAIQRYAGALFGRMPHEEAMSQIITSLQRDGFDLTRPANVQALRAELSRFGGRPVSLADVGAATRARAGVGLRSPSAVQQQSVDQVYSRAQGQGLRLRRDVLENVAPRTDVHALNDTLVAQRAQEAERLRQAALYEGNTPSQGRLDVSEPDDSEPYHLLDYNPSPHIDNSERVGAALSVDDTGNHGSLDIFPPAGEVRNIGANRIGPVAMRDLLRHIRTQFPDLQTISGERITGARTITQSGERTPAIDMSRVQPVGDGLQTRMVPDLQIAQLLQHPQMRRALPAAFQHSSNELALLRATGQDTSHLEVGNGAIDPEQFQQMMESGGIVPDARTLDMIKRHLDREVSTLYRRGSTDTFSAGEAHQVRDLRDALRSRMRENIPGYGDYLDQYSGSSDMIDSLEAGQHFRNLDPEVITAEQGARSTAAQDLYRVGAARDLTNTLNSTSDRANAASRILNSPEERAQLEALGLQPGAAGRLNTAVGQERQLNQLPAELANSSTDARAAARADAEVTPNIPYISANPINWFGSAARWAANHASTQRMAGINEELLPRVLETNRTAIDAIITELEQHGGAQLAAQLRRQQRGSRVTRTFANIIGAPVALPQTENR